MNGLRVGVPKETAPGETLVALAPSHVPLLVKAGLEVSIESGAGDAAVPALNHFTIAAVASGVIGAVDFNETLMHGMLGFLLFAGALHVKLDELLDLKWVIGTLAIIGTMLSSAIIGLLGYAVFDFVGLPLPFLYCLLFGALISPTDPIAVMGILRKVCLPKALEMKIVGESLFNDGVGVVIFLVVLNLLPKETVQVTDVLVLFA